MEQIIGFIGFYLSVIGTWRLASATTKKPIGNFTQTAEKDNLYQPIHDLYAIHKVFAWVLETFKSYKSNGELTDAVILHKQFNWGLLWLLVGICLQYISGLI